jgi:hypothetical protein
MYTLRCTQRLLTRLKEAPLDEAGVTLMPSTTRLGDWYANLHLQHRRAWLLAVSAETLLPVLMPLAGKAPRHERFNAAVDEMMRICGVAPEVRARELAEMREPPLIARTADRSAVASLSQFAFDLRFAWEGDPALPPEALTSTLAQSPTTRLKMDSADRRTRHLLGGQPARQRHAERALKTLGQGRFMTFIRAVRPLDDTLAVKLMAEALDAGQARHQRRFDDRPGAGHVTDEEPLLEALGRATARPARSGGGGAPPQPVDVLRIDAPLHTLTGCRQPTGAHVPVRGHVVHAQPLGSGLQGDGVAPRHGRHRSTRKGPDTGGS